MSLLLASGYHSSIADEPVAVDLPTLQKQFEATDAARAATAPNTLERTMAARQAMVAASDVGWFLFENGESAKAAEWFAKRAILKTEGYAHGKAHWLNQLKEDVPRQEKNFAQKISAWQQQLQEAKDDKKRKELSDGIGALTRMRLVLRYNAITSLEQLARENDDPTTLEKYSRDELALRREELSDLQKLAAPANELNTKRSEIAKALERLAAAQAKMAHFTEAETNLQEALALRHSLPQEMAERELHETFSAQGTMYLHNVGDVPKARASYQDALQDWERSAAQRAQRLAREKTDEDRNMSMALSALTEVLILANLGEAEEELGHYEIADGYFQRVLSISQSLPDGGTHDILNYVKAVTRSRALSELSELHYAEGQSEEGARELDEVIRIKRSIGDDESTAGALQQAAYNLYSQGDLTTARRNLEQVRLIFMQSQKLAGIVSVDCSLATIAGDEDKMDDAARYAEEALPLARQTGNASLVAGSLRTLASIRLKQKRWDDCNGALNEAAKLDSQTGSTLARISTLGWQGQLLEATNHNEEALQKYKQAVSLLEGVRDSSNSATFSENRHTSKAFERLVLLLIKMQKPEEAFDYLSRSRSTRLRESLRLTSLKTGNPALQTLLDRAGTLQNQLQTVRGQLQEEKAKPAGEQSPQKLQALQGLVASTQGEYRRVLEQIKTNHPNYEKVLAVNPKQLKEAQRSIPADTALIQYAPLDNQFFIFIVTRDNLRIFSPQISVEELWKRIKAVRRQVMRPMQNPLPTRGAALAPMAGVEGDSLPKNLTALYAMLITPVESAIADKKTLAFIPTQLLHYLPMAALAREEDGGLHYLVEDKEVVTLNAADVMRIVQAPDDSRLKTGLVAFGDPTGADLPGALEEVRAITQVFPQSSAITEAQVTKAAVTSEATLHKRVVHFATHGILNAVAPDRSYIQLAQNPVVDQARLTVGEVWDLPLQKVDLVTLSACETAIAEGQPDGAEITTLAEAFTSAGAQSVIATLWSVDDNGTKAWMTEFYSELAAGKTKGEAFRGAQLKLISDKQWSHPYYWAPFVLMGDWR